MVIINKYKGNRKEPFVLGILQSKITINALVKVRYTGNCFINEVLVPNEHKNGEQNKIIKKNTSFLLNMIILLKW